MERYPGDDFVDLIGIDNYYDFTPDGDGWEAVTKKLKIVSNIALERNKIAAFTETGLEGIPNERWWTDRLLKSFEDDSIKISYVMVWRNADRNHHYAPYKDHPSANNFVEFFFSPKMLLEKHLPDLYKTKLTREKINSIERQKLIELFDAVSRSLRAW